MIKEHLKALTSLPIDNCLVPKVQGQNLARALQALAKCYSGSQVASAN